MDLCTAAGACGPAFWAHVLERAALHVAASPFLFLGGLAVWHELRWRGRLPRCRGLLLAAVPACGVMLAVALREPFDAAGGNAAVKSVFDLASWLLGLALSFVGLSRYAPRWAEWARVVRRECAWSPRLSRALTPARRRGRGGGA